MKTKRNLTLDFIRGVGIIIVVVAHAMQINLEEGGNNILWMYIRTFQMPLLFFLSGYTAGYAYPCEGSIRYIRQKIMRLFVPYVAWAEIFYLLCCALGYDVLKIEAIFLCLANSPFWFLRHLMIYFIVIWIANIIVNFTKHMALNDSLINALPVVLPCLGSSLIFMFRSTIFLNQANALWQYFWFLAGYILFILIKKKRDIESFLWNNQMLIFSACGIIASFWLYKHVGVNEYIICIFSVISGYLFFGNLSNKCGRKIKALIVKIGNNTLPIYAIHWCILFAPNLYVNWYTTKLNQNFYIINVLLTSTVWIIVCMVLIWLLRMNRITRRVLMGER